MCKATIPALAAGVLAVVATAPVHVPKAALAGAVVIERGARTSAGKVLPMKHKTKTINPPERDKPRIHRGR
jgi:hypothetical protein